MKSMRTSAMHIVLESFLKQRMSIKTKRRVAALIFGGSISAALASAVITTATRPASFRLRMEWDFEASLMSLFKYTIQTETNLAKTTWRTKGHFNFPVWHSSANGHGMYVASLYDDSSYIKRLSRQRLSRSRRQCKPGQERKKITISFHSYRSNYYG